MVQGIFGKIFILALLYSAAFRQQNRASGFSPPGLLDTSPWPLKMSESPGC